MAASSGEAWALDELGKAGSARYCAGEACGLAQGGTRPNSARQSCLGASPGVCLFLSSRALLVVFPICHYTERARRGSGDHASLGAQDSRAAPTARRGCQRHCLGSMAASDTSDATRQGQLGRGWSDCGGHRPRCRKRVASSGAEYSEGSRDHCESLLLSGCSAIESKFLTDAGKERQKGEMGMLKCATGPHCARLVPPMDRFRRIELFANQLNETSRIMRMCHCHRILGTGRRVDLMSRCNTSP